MAACYRPWPWNWAHTAQSYDRCTISYQQAAWKRLSFGELTVLSKYCKNFNFLHSILHENSLEEKKNTSRYFWKHVPFAQELPHTFLWVIIHIQLQATSPQMPNNIPTQTANRLWSHWGVRSTSWQHTFHVPTTYHPCLLKVTETVLRRFLQAPGWMAQSLLRGQ